MIFEKLHIYRTQASFDLLDPGMVVYHPNYLVLCDRARSAALADAGYPSHELWRDGFALALRENHSEYFKPATMEQRLAVLTTTTESSGSSLKVTQRILSEELLPAGLSDGHHAQMEIDAKLLIHQVSISLVCVKLNPLKATRLPERLVTALGLPGRNRT